MWQNDGLPRIRVFIDVVRAADAVEAPALAFEAALDIAAAGKHPAYISIRLL
jgi:hypothetical protein